MSFFGSRKIGGIARVRALELEVDRLVNERDLYKKMYEEKHQADAPLRSRARLAEHSAAEARGLLAKLCIAICGVQEWGGTYVGDVLSLVDQYAARTGELPKEGGSAEFYAELEGNCAPTAAAPRHVCKSCNSPGFSCTVLREICQCACHARTSAAVKLTCTYMDEENYTTCDAVATFTTCDPAGGVVCELHKCRCSKPL